MPVLKSVNEVYQGLESDLTRQSPDNYVRLQLEKELTVQVKEAVYTSQSGKTTLDTKQNLRLLLDSLKAPKNRWTNSFASWFSRSGRVIGVANCSRIGKQACAEMGFTVEEAEKILRETIWDKS